MYSSNFVFHTGNSFVAGSRDDVVDSAIVFLDVLQIVIVAGEITVHKKQEML